MNGRKIKLEDRRKSDRRKKDEKIDISKGRKIEIQVETDREKVRLHAYTCLVHQFLIE